MSYLALARKYRPRRFGEVSTQEHVSETLMRAVAGSRVHHAYLFCGPRGVGKTTIARILAMSLNCPDRRPEGEPCGVCMNCDTIWAGRTSMDVHEIDAASNRGVDDARDLRETVQYAPAEGRHRVYILDEAHMLTTPAWNTLLKTLEEPPSRVVFCFATTEVRKIRQAASPILSRCQRFDFRRIGAEAISARLAEVLDAEGIGYQPAALRAIARKADGGMRDGLSLLDQVLALTADEVTDDVAGRVLGIMPEDRYLEILDILKDRRCAEVFDFVEAILDDGHDLVQFFGDLTERLRLLLRLALDPDAAADAMGSEVRAAFAERAQAFSPGDLVRMLSMCSALEANHSLRRAGRPRVLIEVLLLQLAYLDRTVDLEEVVRALGGRPSGSPEMLASERVSGPSAPPERKPGPGPAPPRSHAASAGPAAAAGRRAGSAPAAAPARTDGRGPVPASERRSGAGSPGRPRTSRKGRSTPPVRTAAASPPRPRAGPRATRANARRGGLDELVKENPGLERAVAVLDLEMLD